ncbi:MAG: hypothetical protein JW789_03850 [Candidatus Aenigmarchaeota archaeon]|nr:hypothetical protein [Candidatus Aenigmarchaeota archaeon]
MRKGNVANIVYAAGLVIMFIISVYYILPALSNTDKNPVMVMVDNTVYLLKDSAEVAKSFVDNSARYSLYQAVYSNSLKGGMNQTVNAVSIGGTTYELWYDGADVSPDEVRIKEELRKTFSHWFSMYVGRSVIKAFTPVMPPKYNDFTFRNDGYYHTGVFAESDDVMRAQMTMENGDALTVSVNADINMSLPIPYFLLVSEGREFKDDIKGQLTNCSSELTKSYEKPELIFSSMATISDGYCIVAVDITSKREFLVWDGSASFKPITLRFAMRQSMS